VRVGLFLSSQCFVEILNDVFNLCRFPMVPDLRGI
jgi:hypothetical protein